jgi:hypothetical protein
LEAGSIPAAGTKIIILFKKKVIMATKAEKLKKTDNAEANRLARLLRTQKKQPNNKQIDLALKTTRMHRKTPVNPIWTASWRKTAQLYKLFTGSFNIDLMSSNADKAFNAAKTTSLHKPLQMPSRPFSLAQRVKDKYGNFVWA